MGTSRVERAATMRIDGIKSLDTLLSTGPRKHVQPGSDAMDRCPISENAILRLPTNDGRSSTSWPRRQPQTGTAFDALNGHCGDLSSAQDIKSPSTTQNMALFAEKQGYQATRSGLVYRYYLHAHAQRLYVFGGCDGLV